MYDSLRNAIARAFCIELVTFHAMETMMRFWEIRSSGVLLHRSGVADIVLLDDNAVEHIQQEMYETMNKWLAHFIDKEDWTTYFDPLPKPFYLDLYLRGQMTKEEMYNAYGIDAPPNRSSIGPKFREGALRRSGIWEDGDSP